MLNEGPFLGQIKDELVKYGSGCYIYEYVSGGPKNYAIKFFLPLTGEIKHVVKVKGIRVFAKMTYSYKSFSQTFYYTASPENRIFRNL